MKKRLKKLVGGALAAATVFAPWTVGASSHREAPFITENPKVDGTDLYAFRSYETGRDGTCAAGAPCGYVTLIANYQPLQAAYGGPNYFNLDPDAIYEIHIDNTGDGIEDLTFQFDFDLKLAMAGNGLALPIGGQMVEIPLAHFGGMTATPGENQNIVETYKVNLVRGARRTGTVSPIMNGDSAEFPKPFDNAGTKTIANYATYVAPYIRNINIPGCTPTGTAGGSSARVFVGQRQEGFAVNLGQIFDLVNMTVGALGQAPSPPRADLAPVVENPNQGKDVVTNSNVTSIALEIPASCLAKDGTSPIIAAWTTASVRQARVINPSATFTTPAREGGPWAQVSRLGMILVNEVVIGLKDKNKWNTSEPKDDGQFAKYVTNPTLPRLVEIVFGAAAGSLAPNAFPRADLVAAFLNGVPTVNKMSDTLFEAVRLNTAVGPTPRATQSYLGAATCFDAPVNNASGPMLNLSKVGCDPAGFPNGRRPGDDTVDIALRVVMGFLLPQNNAPIRGANLTDGAAVNALQFQGVFPYLNNPLPGSP